MDFAALPHSPWHRGIDEGVQPFLKLGWQDEAWRTALTRVLTLQAR